MWCNVVGLQDEAARKQLIDAVTPWISARAATLPDAAFERKFTSPWAYSSNGQRSRGPESILSMGADDTFEVRGGVSCDVM